MFNDNEYLKQKFRDFINEEIEELQQHKLRFFALFFSLLISIALIFTEDGEETIEINTTSQIEETTVNSNEEDVKPDKKNSNKKVISVKKDSNKSEREKVVAVLGANSDELYVGDPFQSYEEPLPKIQEKPVEISAIPQQVPIIPPMPDKTLNLPPIPSVVPQITESVNDPKKTVEQEFILTGTVVNFNKKSAVVQKISTTQGQNKRIEDLILNVGDSLEGHQIVDITPSAVLFDDGHRINSNYLSSDISIVTDETDVEIEDIPANYSEIPIIPVSISDSAVPVTPDVVSEYSENLPVEDNLKNLDTVVEEDISVEDVKNFVQIDDKNLDLNSGTTDKLTEFDTDVTNIEVPVSNDNNTTTNNVDAPFNIQADSFASGNNSP